MSRFLSHMAQLHLDFQFKCSGMELINDMKTKAKSVVESSYEFDTSQAQSVIHNARNASRAQALLAKTSFIYRVHLIVSHLYPTEHRVVHRISTLAGAHVIHIDTP